MRFLTFLPCALMLACAPLPDIGPIPASDSGKPPDLLPINSLMAGIPEARANATTGETLAARAQRLQNRARLMKGPVLDPATRERLRAAIAAGRA